MLKIRLQRIGRAHEPSFRLVLTDSKNSTKSGRLSEVLGSYDPRKTIESFNGARIKYWLAKGADATASVNNLLVKHGIIRGKKIHVSAVPPPTPVVAEEPVQEVAAPVSAEEVPAAEPIVEETPRETSTTEAPQESEPQV